MFNLFKKKEEKSSFNPMQLMQELGIGVSEIMGMLSGNPESIAKLGGVITKIAEKTNPVIEGALEFLSQKHGGQASFLIVNRQKHNSDESIPFVYISIIQNGQPQAPVDQFPFTELPNKAKAYFEEYEQLKATYQKESNDAPKHEDDKG